MQFGHFDDERREYVITTPKTPYPWINYLGSEAFFGLISHQAGGYCFYRDARLRRILRFRYNGVPADGNGRYFYVSEGGEFWSPAYAPVKKQLDFFECRHGLGYTTIVGTRNQLRTEETFFVPLGRAAEVHRVRLVNESNRARHFKLFSFVEFCLWNAHDDMTNFQRNWSTGEVEVEGNTLFHKTEYRERRNHYAFYHSSLPIAGFDPDRDSFVGPHEGLHEPDAVRAGASRNSLASGWAPIASHSISIELEPGEDKTCVFVLGYVENPPEEKWQAPSVVNKQRAHELIQALSEPAAVELELERLREYWTGLLDSFKVNSADPRLNRMTNTWNPYQCMVTFNLSRSASYFESGIGRGMGFRDSNQDLLGFVHLVPDRARERILEISATQLENGGAYHQYQPLTKRGNHEIGGGFNDDPLWLILAVAAYVKETGDYAILGEQVPFDSEASKAAPMLEHLKRAFDHVVNNLGPHGLPLIGRADWNDCLNLNCFSETPDESFQTTGIREGRTAESVLIAGMFVFIGPEYAELVERYARQLAAGGSSAALGEAEEEARRARSAIADVKRAVLSHGWDGEWFLRAYDFHGNKVGSHENEEGRIFIESQGFCAMAGIGVEEGHVQKALDAVKEHLDTPFGIVLNSPAYTRYHPELGEISSYPPGYKENGGIFCHNNPWIMIAEALLGNGKRAFEYYRKIAPSYLEEMSEIHKTEPYVYAQMIAGKEAIRHGEAKNSWLTGTAAWNFVAISQYLLGIRPEYDGLSIKPCIAEEIGDFSVTRKCRGATYQIQVRCTAGSSNTAPKVMVNGRPIAGHRVPYAPAGETVRVVCEV